MMLLSMTLLLSPASNATAPNSDSRAQFDSLLKPLFAQHCIKCHGGEKTKGKVNLREITTSAHLRANPKLLKELIEAVDSYDMPPEDEPEIPEAKREELLASLKATLREATAANPEDRHVQIRRLNRFQYNNAVRDLFGLNRDLFALPEKLMTRHSNYLAPDTRKMPDKVEVACHSLSPAAGMRNVKSFPKDLRAAHGGRA